MAFQSLPRAMRALALPPPPYHPSDPYPPSSLEYHVSHPAPISPSHYTIRVAYTALTRGELTWSETLSPTRKTSTIPGHDVCGTIVSVPTEQMTGPEALKFNVGDKVFGLLSFSRDGAAAEYALASEDELALKPRIVGGEEAVSMPLSSLSAWQALFEHGGLEPPSSRPAPLAPDVASTGRKVLVTGASGGVGVMAVQLLKYSGNHVVLATCSHRNADFVQSLGADGVVDYTAFPTLAEGVANLRLGAGRGDVAPFDTILDTVGGRTLEECCSPRMIRDGGTVVSVAGPLSPEKKQELGIMDRGVECVFFIVRPDGSQLQKIADLAEEENLRGVVDSVWDLRSGREAMERVEGERCRGKVVLKVEPGDLV